MNLNILNQPYPYYYEGKTLIRVALIAFAFTTIFYFVFTPFTINTSEHKFGFAVISLIHATIPFLGFLILGTILNFFISDAENWTVKKELIFVFFFLLVAGIGQYLIRDLIYNKWDNWAIEFLIEEIRNTFAIGIVFFSIWIPIHYNRLVNRNASRASDISKGIKKHDTDINQVVAIKTQVHSDDFELNLSDFKYAKADRNYLEFYIDSSSQTKLVKRISTKELEDQLSDIPEIMKSHRSYIVNLNGISEVKGNAQGYKLVINGFDEEVPVSRNMIPLFEKKFKNISNNQ